MRASELLGARVVDPGGAPIGKVLDVRVVQDGPLLGTMAALRIDGLVVGRRTLTSRLGFDRASVEGPALLRQGARWLMRHNRYLLWDRVELLPDGGVRATSADLPPVPMLPGA